MEKLKFLDILVDRNNEKKSHPQYTKKLRTQNIAFATIQSIQKAQKSGCSNLTNKKDLKNNISKKARRRLWGQF